VTIRALRVAALGVLVSLGTTFATGSGAPGAAAAQGVLSTVTTAVSAPANAATAPDASLAATACVPADGCLSVGTYVTSALRVEPMAAPSVNGVAQRAVAGVLPAAAGAGATGALRAVSCPSFEQCLAAGDFTTSKGRTIGYVEGFSGAAQYPTVPPTPADAAADPRELLDGVSCPPTGGCTVAGSYATSASSAVPFLERLTPAGHWLAPLVPALPLNAALPVHGQLTAVSCWGTGACLLAGTFLSSAGTTLPYVVRLGGDTSTSPSALSLPAGAATDPRAVVASVSCPSATFCVVAGNYRTAAGATALFATTLGASPSAVSLALPADSLVPSQVSGGAVACASPGACELAASYVDGTHSTAGLVASLGAPGWATATRVVAPALASGAAEHLAGASCSSRGQCTVVGSYTDGAHRTEAAIGASFLAPGPATSPTARQVGPTTVLLRWTAPGAPGAGVSSYDVAEAAGSAPSSMVAVTASTSIVLGGLRADVRYRFSITAHADDGATSAPVSVVLTTLRAATAPRSVRAAPKVRSAVLSWQAPANTFGRPVTGYVIDVTWSGGKEELVVGNRTTVTVTDLAAGRTDTFVVAAMTPAGTGAFSAPVTCTPTG